MRLNSTPIIHFSLNYLVTDVGCELDEIVFDGYVSGPCNILPSAA